MFNFYSIFIFVLIITLWFVCSVTLIQVPDLYYNFSDLYTRLWLNEFFLNMYYFYWTSFWYLVVIVAITKLTFVLVYVRYVTPNLLAFTTCLLVYTTTMYEYYDHNFIHSSLYNYKGTAHLARHLCNYIYEYNYIYSMMI